MGKHDIFDLLINEEDATERATKMNGLVLGIVTSNKDEENLGRVKVKYPDLSEEIESDWARVCSFMAGGERGSFFVPEVNDHVVVAFLHGDINRPVIIGCLYSKEDMPPEKTADGENNLKEIRTRSGHKLIFNDKNGKETIKLESSKGHKIILDDSIGGTKIDIEDNTGQNKIVIDSITNSIEISSNMNLKLNATNIEINAKATMTLKANTLLKIEGLPVKIN